MKIRKVLLSSPTNGGWRLTETQHHSWWYPGSLCCSGNQRKYHKCEILLFLWLFCVSFFTCKVVL